MHSRIIIPIGDSHHLDIYDSITWKGRIMKKYYAVILTFIMAISVAACGSSNEEKNLSQSSEENVVIDGTDNQGLEIYELELDSQPSDRSEDNPAFVEDTKEEHEDEDSLETTDANNEETRADSNVVPTDSKNHVDVAEVHNHNYIMSSVLEATCTLEGTVLYTCECGANYTESLSAQGHDYAGGATCVRCGASNPDYVPVHVHEWKHETRYTLNHTNEGHYAPYICECRLDFQSYEELEAHQEETAIKSRESYRDENGVWHGDIAHGGWCNGWIVEREWDFKCTSSRDVCSCGEIANEQRIVEEVDCTCVHYGPDMHFHFADRDCCNTDWK